jgi:N-acetylglucosamine kinase-like BadF-type ATPase
MDPPARDPTGGEAARPVVVGVDGGGTGSRALVLAADGRELARESGRAALVRPGTEEDAVSALQELVGRALTAAGIPAEADALVAGLAGVGREKDRARTEELLRGLGLARELHVRHDVSVAFHDAFSEGPGILLVAGTGSVAFCRTPSGRERRVGGWGGLVGDEGSGWSLGIQGLGAALRAIDGRGPDTVLARRLPEALGFHEADDMVRALWDVPKGRIASLAPLVVAAADEGDPVASGVVDEAVAALAAHLAPLVEEWRRDAPGAEPPVALVGGLVTPGGPLRSRLEPRIRALGAVPTEAAPDPARGAARMALLLLEAG